MTGATGATRVAGAIGGAGLILALTTAPHAQTNTAAAVSGTDRYIDLQNGLSLAEAIAGAVEREPSLRASRAVLEAARAMRRQAGLRANPSLMVERREEPSGTDNQTIVQLSMPMELFRRSARTAVADREVEVAGRSVEDRTRLLVNEIKMRYGQAAAAVRDMDIADTLAVSARRDLELLRRRVDEGASPPIDRDRLAVEVHRLDAARRRAAGRAEIAVIELTRALGLEPHRSLKLSDTIDSLGTIPPPAHTDDDLARADVREADARVQLAQARIAAAQAEGRFDLTVFGSYMRMNAGFPQYGFSPAGSAERVHGVFHYASGGAMVMLPMWNRNQGAVAAARAEHEAARARLDAFRIAARAEIAAASARVFEARGVVEAVSDGAVLARKNLDVVRQTYELGRGTLSDVLVEQRQYLDLETAYTSALHEAFQARTSLEFAQGRLK